MADPGDIDFVPPDPSALQMESGVSQTPMPNNTPAGRVLQAHHDALMKLPGVVMIAEGQDVIGNPAIIIGVKAANHLRGLPASIDGVPVVAQVIGEIDALSNR